MCEAIIVMRDIVSSDPLKDCKLLKRGDVIVIVPDGWVWSQFELTAPNWRIVKFPLVSVDEASIFVSVERDLDPANPSRMLRQRALSVNVDSPAISANTRAWLDNDTRVEPTLTILFTLQQMIALSISKPPLPDPNVMI